MKINNIFLTKFAIIALSIGVFSPSISIKPKVQTITQNSYSNISSITIDISLVNAAEAAPIHRQTRRVSRRTSRRTSRRVNYRHNAGRYYGSPHHHHHHHHHGYFHGAPILTFATGMAIGSIIAASTMPPSCTNVVVRGISYRRCGNSYYQPFYQGDTLVYKVVPSPY